MIAEDGLGRNEIMTRKNQRRSLSTVVYGARSGIFLSDGSCDVSGNFP